MVTIQDYRNALTKMTCQDIYTEAWRQAKNDLEKLTDQALSEGNRRIAAEVADGLDSLYETLAEWNGDKTGILADIKNEDNRLRQHGFSDIADRVKTFWENED